MLKLMICLFILTTTAQANMICPQVCNGYSCSVDMSNCRDTGVIGG